MALLPDGEIRDRVLGGAANRAKVDAYIQALADAAPPLTPGQKAKLRVLLARPNASTAEADLPQFPERDASPTAEAAAPVADIHHADQTGPQRATALTATGARSRAA